MIQYDSDFWKPNPKNNHIEEISEIKSEIQKRKFAETF